jgi:peptidoglycan/LPS O-acetylase OafA/YrhL
MNYRREIDGLRAVAVLPVILFHAGFRIFSGGFVGVDIFFVISGYVITSVILTEKQSGTFTLIGFYERRARRILPALFVVMLACLPFALLWMLPDYLENFGQSLIATTFFSNNVLLWLTTGYFALENDFKPLVHTWSLGIEEQYYILFPIFIILFWGLGKRWLVFLIGFAAVLSFSLAEWGSSNQPDAAFYLLPTRGWELLLGAMSAFLLSDQSGFLEKLRSQDVGQGLGVLGLIMISYSVFAFDNNTPFPGMYALIPTIGTALIILFTTEHTWVGKLLGIKVVVFIGLLSYSAYLWHQPLFAFARLRSLSEPNTLTYLGLGLLSLLLAYPTWRYVENPFRNKAVIERRAIGLLSVVVGLLMSCVGFVFHANSGFIHSWPELNADIQSAGRRLNAVYNERPFIFKDLLFNDPQKRNVLIWGNSFARDFINSGLENGYFSESEISYTDYEASSCLQKVTDIPEPLRSLISVTDYLVLTSSHIDIECWKSDFDIFEKLGARKIVVIGTKNFGWNMNAVMLINQHERYGYRAQVLKEVVMENDRVAHALPGEYFVNMLVLISDGDGRVPVFTEDKKIISQDRIHLTKDGAKFIGEKLFEHPLLSPLK